MKYNVENLIEAGANRWTKNGKDRVYLSKIGNELIGLECSYYKSGNLSSAYLAGEKISNAEAQRVMSVYSRAYVNAMTGELHDVNGRDEYVKTFLEAMKRFEVA